MRRVPVRRNRTIATLVAVALLVGAGAAVTPLSATTKKPKESAGEGVAKPVDLNRATQQELTGVPGIGKVLAERIVKFRDRHGPFRRVEDLLKVKGIGEKSFDKLRPHVTVGKKA
jgi:competence protein ComEA